MFDADEALAGWYARALAESPIACESRMLATRFGATHALLAGASHLPAAVLIPGFGTNGALFLRTMALLAPTRRVCALDIPGHPGRSGASPVPAAGPEFAQWLEDALEGLGIRSAAFMGTSLGAFIVLKLAAHAPERISRAMLVVPGGLAPVSKTGMVRLGARIAAQRFFPSRERVRGLLRLLGDGAAPDERIAELLEIALLPGRFHPDRGIFGSVPASTLQPFDSPVLVVAGERDILFPHAEVRRRAAALRQAEVRVIPGMGHLPAPVHVQLLDAAAREFLGAGPATG